MLEYFFNQEDGDQDNASSDIAYRSGSGVRESEEDIAAFPLGEQGNSFPKVPFSAELESHRLLFDRGGQGAGRLVLHLHRQDADECTAICKGLAHCTVVAQKMLKKRVEKQAPTICAQCGTLETPLWRKANSVVVCNACGLYSRTHNGMYRPSHLFKDTGRPKGGKNSQ